MQLKDIIKAEAKGEKWAISGCYPTALIIQDLKRDNPEFRSVTNDTVAKIVRALNESLSQGISKGVCVEFPYNLGSFEIRKGEPKIRKSNGRIHILTNRDWGTTMNLWMNDKEARDKKLIVGYLNSDYYKIVFTRGNPKNKNYKYYKFKPCKSLFQKMVNNLREGIVVDALPIK